MEKYVETGSWNGFTFRRATHKDEEAIAELLRTSYYPDEPFTELLGLTEEYENDFRRLWRTFFDDNMCFVALDQASGELAGVRLIFNHKKDMDWSKFNFQAPQTAKIFECLRVLDEGHDFFEKYKIDNFADLFITCVGIKFRHRGLVTELYNRSILLTRDRGFFLATACFTSPFSRKAALNAGFEQTAIIKLKDVMDPKTGLPLIPNATSANLFSRSVIFLQSK